MIDNDFSSDLAVLNERCIKNCIPSPVKFVKDALEILGYDAEQIFDATRITIGEDEDDKQ
jgi:hypothetical protein